jgi:hypothetical protein
LNVSIASERQQRKLAKEIWGDSLVAEKGAFSFPADGGGEKIVAVPFVHFPNLIGTVADLVERHER